MFCTDRSAVGPQPARDVCGMNVHITSLKVTQGEVLYHNIEGQGHLKKTQSQDMCDISGTISTASPTRSQIPKVAQGQEGCGVMTE